MAPEELDAVEAFADVIGKLGLQVIQEPEPGMSDLWLDVGGRPIALELKRLASVTPAQLAHLSPAGSGPARDGILRVVVADRITEAVRDELRRAGWGWLDLRGHLHVAGPGLLIDTDVPSLRDRPVRTDPFSAAGLEIACSLLLDPTRRHGVRDLARAVGRSPSTVSEVLNAMRGQRLIDVDGSPVLPDLFWEAAGAWRPREVAVADVPRPGGNAATVALQLGLNDVTGKLGWALTDTLAAAAYGAPVAARSDYPPDFYVPTQAVLRRAVHLLGLPDDRAQRRATVRVAPVPMVCSMRVDPTDQSADPSGWGTLSEFWPLAHPVFVALDLARDPGRGREVVEGWDPPKPWLRVW